MSVEAAYRLAQARYAELGVDTESAIQALLALPISLQCWQGDDVRGFENADEALGGGLAVTGNYPGRARNADELRADLSQALALIPGRHRVNLHAMYGEFGGANIDRDAIETKHFEGWVQWAAENRLGIDFNPTCFSHPLATDGFTLSHQQAPVREFWIEHCRRCRKIGAWFGETLGSATVTNVWIPDGWKDQPIDRSGPRERLRASLDAVFAESLGPTNVDAVESKLFGIGSEAYVTGSHEFYLGYAASRKVALCLDMGHFHPTESVADKLSAVMLWVPRLLLHVSRGLRWDSDHVVTTTDDLLALASELVRGGFFPRTHLGLDYFDASVNRVAAWVVGTCAFQRALLAALLEPIDQLRRLEAEGDLTGRLVLLEESKAMPLGAVWDAACQRAGVPIGPKWLDEARRYEREVLALRR